MNFFWIEDFRNFFVWFVVIFCFVKLIGSRKFLVIVGVYYSKLSIRRCIDGILLFLVN